MKKYVIILILFIVVKAGYSQTTNDILNLLIEKKAIGQGEADSLRADAAIKQQGSIPDKKLKIDLEVRPRSEFRNGYQQLPNDTTIGAFFVNQRSRLSINFVNEDKLAVQFSVQDLRIWGQQDPRLSTSSTIQVFEAWVEPYIGQSLSVRIGRQRLSYDNQRLFSENNWRLGGVTYDALTIKYNSEKLVSDLVLAFNQSSELVTGTNYKPSGFANYKFLALSYLKYNLSNNFTLTALNSADGYQARKSPEKLLIRYNNGGRIEYDNSTFYATISGYYQSGKDSAGNYIDAWYIQPEVRYNLPIKLTVRVGAELFSGKNPNSTSSTNYSFVPLYGSGHSFNGSLDLITRFPGDVRGAGLVNPYLYLIQSIGKKIELRSDFHLFYLKEDYLKGTDKINKYLGFENDWLMGYKPNNFTRIDLGFSFAKVTESFEIVKRAASGAHKHTPTWAYISITFKPQLFSTSFK